MNTSVLATCVAIIYALAQYADKKFVKKESVDFRALSKSTVLVFLSVVCGVMVYDQLHLDDMSESLSSFSGGSAAKVAANVAPAVFTDNPGF
jgi:hypothetical protein